MRKWTSSEDSDLPWLFLLLCRIQYHMLCNILISMSSRIHKHFAERPTFNLCPSFSMINHHPGVCKVYSFASSHSLAAELRTRN